MTLQWHLDKEVGGETKRVGQLLFAESNIYHQIGEPLPFYFSMRFLRSKKPTESYVSPPIYAGCDWLKRSF
jgi:hypothetical protein